MRKAVTVFISCVMGLATATTPVAAATTEVHCEVSPDALSSRLEEARAGDRLLITGVCHGTFVVRQDLTLKGGAGGATLDAEGAGGVLEITAEAKVRLVDLTITGGAPVYEVPDPPSTGGIDNGGTATLVRVTVTSNVGQLVGGIKNDGTMELIDSVVSHNTSEDAGGIANTGRLTLRGSTVTQNYTSYFVGGIAAGGTVVLIDSVVSRNGAARVGGIDGNVTLWRSRVVDNVGGDGVGGISGARLTSYDSTISGNRSFNVGPGGIRVTRALIVRSKIMDNWAGSASAGGIEAQEATIRDSRIRGNSGSPGGLRVTTLKLFGSIVRGNSARYEGGGMDVNQAVIKNSRITGNAAMDGGGIFARGSVVLKNVTFSGNTPNDCTGC